MPLIQFDRGDVVPAYGSRSTYVAAHLREFIVSGHLLPDEQLRVDTVAAHFAVSTTPVREALQTLVVEGFLDRSAGSGFTVHPLTPQDIEDVFLTHAFVAGELAARATPLLTDADIRELRAIHHETVAVLERSHRHLLPEKSRAFHRQINRAAPAPKLWWLTSLFLKYVPQALYSDIEGWPEITRTGQERLLAAIEARDVEAAREAASANILSSGRALAEYFAETVQHQRESTG
ncbi:GntR family transcriptional regulator [Brevibacterium daeguense]|uniref:GntR family transcriptional regulator n=1 Tax=Brevibacterium daeguense TaxID=909936 RepID=A0ABP8EFQ9_9MICO|nr:GntR family transcriptional regulator [Brevibacterium daeguense]